ncbi:uncharacterized protein [Miscanthus floridulus]|uniref:uncharacterized protein n=1 Tax=Miscanthus floridulus TaxID=154761 RepID=UPI003457734F
MAREGVAVRLAAITIVSPARSELWSAFYSNNWYQSRRGAGKEPFGGGEEPCEVLESDKVERRHDRLAVGAMLRGVPEDMHAMLLNKKSAKEAWESLKTMHLGADRVKEVTAQKLLSDFEAISFKTGETIEEFAMRITKLASDLRGLGETSVDDARVVKKFLRVVPPRYNQVAVAIEMFCDVKTLSIEELVGRLRAAEARFEPTVEQVMEEEWMARNKSRMERVLPEKYDDGAWILDTGVTNHMTGCRSSLTSLDKSVCGAVRFGDGLTVEIYGVGVVTMAGRNQEHRVLTEVYFIPSLKCNIVSLGQLEEAGCRVEIDKGVLVVLERKQPGVERGVVIRAERKSRFCYMWLELLAGKDEALACFKRFRAAAELESGRRLKALRTDRGGEFNSRAFVVFCSEHGIKHNTTTPYTPQQNGVVERRNQMIVEMARCLLKSMGVPPRKPGIKHLRTFGCVAYAKKASLGISKLTNRSTPGVFFGYEPGTKGYRIYDPVKDKLMVTRDVIFDEKKPWNWEGKEDSKAKEAAETTDTFQVQWDDTDTILGLATGSEEDVVLDFEPVSPAASIPLAGGASNTPPGTPNSNSGTPLIQWAMPPTGQFVDSEGDPLWYRMIADLLDDTEEI